MFIPRGVGDPGAGISVVKRQINGMAPTLGLRVRSIRVLSDSRRISFTLMLEPALIQGVDTDKGPGQCGNSPLQHHRPLLNL